MKLIVSALLLIATPACAAPILSEIVASNTSSLLDGDGDSPDWIEIFNPDAMPYSLKDHYLTDDPNALSRWPIGDVTIPANDYVVIFASGKARGNPDNLQHTNFRLSSGGEYVALVEPDGKTVLSEISPKYPPLETDQSYAFVGGNTYAITDAPSPNADNADNVVVFATPGQAFTDTITVEMSSPGGGSIRYSTDGQAPSLFNGKTYDGPITLATTSLISASTGGGPFATQAFIKVHPELTKRNSNIPIVVAVAEGRLNQTTLKEMAIAILEPGEDGRARLLSPFALSSRGGIRTRGETSNGFPKKPLRMEFWDTRGEDRDLSPLGMAPEGDWVMNARYSFDRTLMHNAWIYELSNQLGQWAPHTRFVELYLNDSNDVVTEADYQGIYTFMENNQRGGDRVNVERMGVNASAEPEITGGYLFKKDKSDPGTWSISGGSEPLQMVYPPEEERTERKAQGDWLSNYLDEMLDAIRTHGSDPEQGYPKYINVRSWLDHHMMNFLTNNVDAMRISAYFHKPRGGKVFAGPIWDFDRSAGGPSDGRIANPLQWGDGGGGTAFFVRGNHGTPVWWEELFNNADFTQEWIDRWYQLRQTEMVTTPWDLTPLPAFSDASISRIIDHMATELAESQERNFAKWTSARPRNSSGLRYSDKDGYEGEIEHLKGWLHARAAWIEEAFLTVPSYAHSAAKVKISAGGSLFKSVDIYYTTDGSDPRQRGGEASPTAVEYGSAVVLANSVRIKARRLDNSYEPDRWGPSLQWSGLADRYFYVDSVAASSENLVISEIMFHPAAPSDAESAAGHDNDDDFEYIELHNPSEDRVDLTETRLRGDADFNFPDGTVLEPGATAVLVSNEEAFVRRHGTRAAVLGDYANRLDNNAGIIRLRNSLGEVMHEIAYLDSAPWPADSDGSGQSLSLTGFAADLDNTVASNWTAAIASPGTIVVGATDTGSPEYNGWIKSVFSAAEQADVTISGPNADPDADGLPNLAEFALQGDSHAKKPNKLPTFAISADGKVLELYYRRLISSGVTVSIELSSDLATWSPVPAGSETTTALPDNTQSFEDVVSLVRLDDQPSRYVRLNFKL